MVPVSVPKDKHFKNYFVREESAVIALQLQLFK